VPLNSTIYKRTKDWLSFLRTKKPAPSEKEEDRPQSRSVTYLGHEESQDDILLPPELHKGSRMCSVLGCVAPPEA
jgi:hypothetical protein